MAPYGLEKTYFKGDLRVKDPHQSPYIRAPSHAIWYNCEESYSEQAIISFIGLLFLALDMILHLRIIPYPGLACEYCGLIPQLKPRLLREQE